MSNKHTIDNAKIYDTYRLLMKVIKPVQSGAYYISYKSFINYAIVFDTLSTIELVLFNDLIQIALKRRNIRILFSKTPDVIILIKFVNLIGDHLLDTHILNIKNYQRTNTQGKVQTIKEWGLYLLLNKPRSYKIYTDLMP